MKKISILIVSIFVFTGCNTANQQSVNVSTQSSNNSLIVSSHSTESQTKPSATVVPKSETKTKWTQSGDPIDTSKFDAEVAKAEKDLKAKSQDTSAKKALAESYINRGLALTDARQYASALGDYRRALKYDPDNQEAKKWINQIIGIYEGLNKEYPKDGEEPPPLPFKKG
jgi:hypothetical protein